MGERGCHQAGSGRAGRLTVAFLTGCLEWQNAHKWSGPIRREGNLGLFDWLTGTKRPAAGVTPNSADEVRAAVLAVNRPSAPFVVRDGAPEQVDLVAEWRIVDAAWHSTFATAGLAQVFKVLMRLDPAKREVRATDQEWSVEWRAGVPSLKVAAKAFRGQKTEIKFGSTYSFTEKGEAGRIHQYSFSTAELKTPLQDAVTGAEWTWRGVAFGKL